MDRFGFGGIVIGQVPPNVLSAAARSDYMQKIQADSSPRNTMHEDTAGLRQGMFPEADLPVSCH